MGGLRGHKLHTPILVVNSYTGHPPPPPTSLSEILYLLLNFDMFQVIVMS